MLFSDFVLRDCDNDDVRDDDGPGGAADEHGEDGYVLLRGVPRREVAEADARDRVRRPVHGRVVPTSPLSVVDQLL